jgi:serine protease AprX
MKNAILLFFVLTFTGLTHHTIFGQVAPNTYVVFFNTKAGTPYTLDNPLEYLTQRALDRRTKHQIAIDSTDLPVNPAFLDSLDWVTADVLYTSRWFNYAVIDADPADIPSILNFSFVSEVKSGEITKYKVRGDKFPKIQNSNLKNYTSYFNDYMRNQINITPLHNMGLTGSGVRIAVIDAGFQNLDQCSSFAHVINYGRVIDTKNFVNNSSVYENSLSRCCGDIDYGRFA